MDLLSGSQLQLKVGSEMHRVGRIETDFKRFPFQHCWGKASFQGSFGGILTGLCASVRDLAKKMLNPLSG